MLGGCCRFAQPCRRPDEAVIFFPCYLLGAVGASVIRLCVFTLPPCDRGGLPGREYSVAVVFLLVFVDLDVCCDGLES